MEKPDHPADDEISRALAGSEAEIDWAIGRIWQKHGSRLYAWAYRRTEDDQAAREAVDDTLIVLLRKAQRGEWRDNIQLENFLNRVVVYKAIEMWRRRQRHTRHLSDTPFDEQKNLPTVPSEVVWGEIVNKDEQGEEVAKLSEFIASLKRKQKMVAQILNDFFLQHGRRPTMQEIGEEMKSRGDENANQKSVQSIMRELRKKWRKSL